MYNSAGEVGTGGDVVDLQGHRGSAGTATGDGERPQIEFESKYRVKLKRMNN